MIIISKNKYYLTTVISNIDKYKFRKKFVYIFKETYLSYKIFNRIRFTRYLNKHSWIID